MVVIARRTNPPPKRGNRSRLRLSYDTLACRSAATWRGRVAVHLDELSVASGIVAVGSAVGALYYAPSTRGASISVLRTVSRTAAGASTVFALSSASLNVTQGRFGNASMSVVTSSAALAAARSFARVAVTSPVVGRLAPAANDALLGGILDCL